MEDKVPNETAVATNLHPMLSPARAALADISRDIMRANAEVERAAVPVVRLKDQLLAATAQQQVAEAALAAIDEQHAAAIQEAAKSGAKINLTKPPTSEKAEAAVESARRVVASVRTALTACEAEAGAARVSLRDTTAKADQFVLGVIVEEIAVALDRLSRARTEYVAAEAEVFALIELPGEHGRSLPFEAPNKTAWLLACTAAKEAYGKSLRPESTPAEVTSALARWRQALGRLALDPTAAA